MPKTTKTGYDMWLTKSAGLIPGRDLLGPLALIVIMPPFMVLLPYILKDLDGSLVKLWQKWMDEGVWKVSLDFYGVMSQRIIGCLVDFGGCLLAPL